MTWLLAHSAELAAAAFGVWGAWENRKARKRKREAQRLANELDAIRTHAGTKALWESLPEQARAARLRAKPG